MRRLEVGTAIAFVLIAVVAMLDSRRGALIGATRDPGGIGSGFFPFWASAVLALAAIGIVCQKLLIRDIEQAGSLSLRGLRSVGTLVIPMIVAASGMVWFGFYVMVGAYMGFFARLIGHYRWIWVVTIAAGVPLLIYLVFELGFRMLLPKSILYGYFLPF